MKSRRILNIRTNKRTNSRRNFWVNLLASFSWERRRGVLFGFFGEGGGGGGGCGGDWFFYFCFVFGVFWSDFRILCEK